jgi:murein DD-endopeptidase MepM/ murein hydrolase activator NlpD
MAGGDWMITLSRPSKGKITENFGPRPKPTPTSPAIHYGIDFGWGNGKEIYAVADGVVTSTSFSGAYGNRTIVDHGDGIQTWYCHQSAQLVKVGDKVKRLQQIGVQGATGNVVGTHLHFELRINGVATDPALYMTTTAGIDLTPLGDTMLKDDPELQSALDEIRALAGTGAGYFRKRSPEEINQAERFARIDESYRMIVQLVTGRAAPSTVPDENNLWAQIRGGVDLDALAQKIADRLPKSGVTAEQIAAEFSKRLGS